MPWRPLEQIRAVGSIAKTKLFGERRIRVQSLETPLTDHCNLSCAGCDHASPFLAERFLDLDLFSRDLHKLAGAMRAREFRLVGGEPLLHPKLRRIIDIIRHSGISDGITVITNGVLIGKAEPYVWENIDRLWLSDYPGIRLRMPVDEIAAKCRQHSITFDYRPTEKFRHVVINRAIDDDNLVKKIYSNCKAAHEWKCYTVANGYFFKCGKPSVVRDRLRLTGETYQQRHRDGVDLHGKGSLHRRLKRYLRSRTPLGACYYCLGTSGPSFSHHQLKRQDLKRELETDHRPLINQVRKELCGR